MSILTDKEIEFIRKEAKELNLALPTKAEELRKILRRLFKKYHPDGKGESYNEISKENFLMVNEINEKLAEAQKCGNEIDVDSIFGTRGRHSKKNDNGNQGKENKSHSSKNPIQYVFKGERIDGRSYWILKFLEKVEIDKNTISSAWIEPKEGRVLYKYSFKEFGDCDDTTERILYTEMSPEYITEINNSRYHINVAFQSNFFKKERTQKIFREVTPNRFGEWSDLENDYLGNGYAGYIDIVKLSGGSPYPFLKNNEEMLSEVYKLYKQERFIKPLKQGYIRFKRDDDTSFELKYNKRFDSLEDIFIYSLRDPQIDSGKEKTLYTELSPEDIFRLINNQDNPNSLRCFVNDFLGVKRLKQVFTNRPSKKFESLEEFFKSTYSSDNDEHIGNGYAGYIEENLWGWNRIPKIKCCEFSFNEICASQRDTSYGEETKTSSRNNAIRSIKDDDFFSH